MDAGHFPQIGVHHSPHVYQFPINRRLIHMYRTSPIIGKPIWERKVVFIVTYFFNLSTGLIVFILPFFMLPHLKLSHRQRLSVIGIFSLGFITIIMSVSRFAVFVSAHNHLGPASEGM